MGVSEIWVADQGDGTYKNPILHADYSDPDVVRVGVDFFSLFFQCSSWITNFDSKDLVNWKLVGHALKRQIPLDHFNTPYHGNGV